MNARDWEYIESRLLAPAVDALDALIRMGHLGYTDEANQLWDALRGFNDKTRAIRRQLETKRRAGR